ncbi:hypothetical protein [Dyadobacter sandarakinus]|uniref:Uncharacterized protein n=1 Tax=Dyadobacter sandarakinus TaxID=2747268 RepID=A0ABX7I541_9BACT|nr:hypothetical protein [Dyadobacter sandarakinus]QRR00910.1 hypothetical protein HWI92_08345 [Dyadobacter sandarakinus]
MNSTPTSAAQTPHSFHIPVLGLGYSIDTPLKVARYGISSTVSIVDDELIERMRKFHAVQSGTAFTSIPNAETDFRSKRITAYLNLLNVIVARQFAELRQQSFGENNDLARYFNLLPDDAPLKQRYKTLHIHHQPAMLDAEKKWIRQAMEPGAIDVNIMSKVDKMNRGTSGQLLSEEFSDALAALRGFAKSTLRASLVLSAGMNPKLYSYLESFPEFLPKADGCFFKKITLKVSDFRSASIQARFLAKKGLWVSEFRIESGLNCGGHAFATEGLLLGPVLEEFRRNREALTTELFGMWKTALAARGRVVTDTPAIRITVQGGIGNVYEDQFLREHYGLDGTGWGSAFLLVPEATNVDEQTLKSLTEASHDDYYLSNASPLGILFNNFRKSSAEKQRLERIAKGRPGSPCQKRYLVSNTEFTEEPICTASRQYQALKMRQLQETEPRPADLQEQLRAVSEKICLCEGLGTSALIRNHLLRPRENQAVAICPGPNLAWFSKTYSLEEMTGHIYGKTDLLEKVERPHMFVNELRLYIDYLKEEMQHHRQALTDKKKAYFARFRQQLLDGIRYYQNLVPDIYFQHEEERLQMQTQLVNAESELNKL